MKLFQSISLAGFCWLGSALAHASHTPYYDLVEDQHRIYLAKTYQATEPSFQWFHRTQTKRGSPYTYQVITQDLGQDCLNQATSTTTQTCIVLTDQKGLEVSKVDLYRDVLYPDHPLEDYSKLQPQDADYLATHYFNRKRFFKVFRGLKQNVFHFERDLNQIVKPQRPGHKVNIYDLSDQELNLLYPLLNGPSDQSFNFQDVEIITQALADIRIQLLRARHKEDVAIWSDLYLDIIIDFGKTLIKTDDQIQQALQDQSDFLTDDTSQKVTQVRYQLLQLYFKSLKYLNDSDLQMRLAAGSYVTNRMNRFLTTNRMSDLETFRDLHQRMLTYRVNLLSHTIEPQAHSLVPLQHLYTEVNYPWHSFDKTIGAVYQPFTDFMKQPSVEGLSFTSYVSSITQTLKHNTRHAANTLIMHLQTDDEPSHKALSLMINRIDAFNEQEKNRLIEIITQLIQPDTDRIYELNLFLQHTGRPTDQFSRSLSIPQNIRPLFDGHWSLELSLEDVQLLYRVYRYMEQHLSGYRYDMMQAYDLSQLFHLVNRSISEQFDRALRSIFHHLKHESLTDEEQEHLWRQAFSISELYILEYTFYQKILEDAGFETSLKNINQFVAFFSDYHTIKTYIDAHHIYPETIGFNYIGIEDLIGMLRFEHHTTLTEQDKRNIRSQLDDVIQNPRN